MPLGCPDAYHVCLAGPGCTPNEPERSLRVERAGRNRTTPELGFNGMNRMFLKPISALLALFWILLVVPLVQAQSSVIEEVTPEQAREVLDALQDDESREEVLRALEERAAEESAEES